MFQNTQSKPTPQKNVSTKYSLHDFTLLHILDHDLIHHRTRALTDFPQYYANQPTDYLLPVKDLLKHQSHKYMHILNMFNQFYRPNPTLFKVMTSTETAGTFSLTNLLCYPAIEYLGTPQQFLHYSRLIEEGRIVGSYAQTEVGHGSDVQGLCTEAVYDPAKKCLVFNTPSIHGIKFWPGGLGIFGTHIITQAKLIVEGQSHGLQTFIIPIRDTKTLQPLKGAIVGDLGPKLGFKAADNGYLQFDKLEASVDTLLARFVQLDMDGKVTKSEDKNANKIAYGSMMTLRGNLLRFFSELFSKGMQMGHIHRKVEERQPYEVRKDLDMLTHYYAFGLCSYHLTNLLKSFLAGYYNDQKMALRMIPEIHFLTTGFKTLSSWKIVKSSREEASAMGLGDLIMSGVVQLYSDAVPTPTYEGDNVVLMLQVLRVLLGSYTGLMSSKTLTGSLEFLNRFQDYAVEQKEFDEVIEVAGVEDLFMVSEKILENYTFKLIQTVCKKIQKSAMEDGVPLKRVLSEGLQTELVQTALKVFEAVNYKLAMKVYEDKNTTAMLNDRDAAILGNMLQLHKFAYIKEKLNHILESKVVKFNEDIEEIVVQAKEIYYVDLVPELDYLYRQGFLKQVELSTVRNYKNLDHKVYLNASGNISEALKEAQEGLLKFSKL